MTTCIPRVDGLSTDPQVRGVTEEREFQGYFVTAYGKKYRPLSGGALISYFTNLFVVVKTKDENIGFYGYIGTWILRIYRIYRCIFLHEYRYIGN